MKSSRSHGQIPFDVLVDYPDHDMLAVFRYEGERTNGEIHVCPGNMDIAAHMHIGDPEAIRKTPEVEWLTLNTATGMSVDNFFIEFTQNNPVACLTTPIDLWN